ncbi:hypothetical protein [Aurantibacillus circumpalustris]|uniref:hypothetical protein n=1 Tax=Aurantibacillus circumpalustris TaxID=3036359 RepID=UPI00295AEB2A|nr:hypothetical protein [Aurantibacillus circumpalustris]
MKTTKTILYFVIGLLLSCSKEKEPTLTACISGPETVERGKTATYSWCGTDVDDVINWTTSYGETGVSSSFLATFPSVGTHTITVTGKLKGKAESKSIVVNYGSSNTITCFIKNECSTGNQNIQNPDGYKAYLYNSYINCNSDLKNGGHQLALDSTACKYSSSYSTITAEFKTTATPGSTLYLVVEGLSSVSNYGNISTNGGIALQDNGAEIAYITVDNYSKMFLRGKWKLSYQEFNTSSVNIAPCNQDDYLEFFMDGTWKYQIGSDDCNGASQQSNGKYSYAFPLCNIGGNPSYIALNTLSGPFTGVYGLEFTPSQIKVNYQIGSNYGFFRFNYSN